MEAVNQTIETMLHVYIGLDCGEWAQWLPLICPTYNSSVHSATGYSPYFLLYGMEALSDLDKLANLTPHICHPQGLLEHAHNFVSDITAHRKQARVALAIAQEQVACTYNKKR